MPKLFEWPPVRSIAHSLDRASLALLVGGSLFVFFTGILNIQLFYPWGFSFVPAHYYGAFVFLAALGLHLVTKVPIALQGLSRARRDRARCATTSPTQSPSRYGGHTTAPYSPQAPTISRRGMLATVGAGSLGLFLIAIGQVVGGPFRRIAFLAPRGSSGGPNGFQVNKSFAAAGIAQAKTGDSWRLVLDGAERVELSRDDLLAMTQRTESLPIACVEGWSTTQSWTGVPLRELAGLAGVEAESEATVKSLQIGGAFGEATLAGNQVGDERSLLALRVNDEDLSLDHGYPARIIVPAAPGVHCTKWVSSISFTEVSVSSRLRDSYGDGPLHLIAVGASFAIVGYAFLQIAQQTGPLSFVVFFAGAIVVHDLIAFPIYSLLDRIAGRAGATVKLSGGLINYVRIPALLSGFAFIVWFALILELDPGNYEASTATAPPDYLGRWLVLTAALFLGSGVVYAIRARRALRSRRARDRDRAKDPRDARNQR